MGLFRPYERRDREDEAGKPDRTKLVLTRKSVEAQQEKAAVETAAPAKKKVERQPDTGRKTGPTLTRRQAEAARMERLHPTLTRREARRRDRAATAERREEAWAKTESSPERALVRDYVDARWTLTEFMLPVMLLVMALTMTTTMWVATMPGVLLLTTALLYGLILVWAGNMFWLWRGFKRELSARHPDASTRGLLMYLVNRSMMIRRFRRPPPRIARGDKY